MVGEEEEDGSKGGQFEMPTNDIEDRKHIQTNENDQDQFENQSEQDILSPFNNESVYN